MKAVRIDFVPSRRWALIWLAGGLATLALLGIWAWKAVPLLQQQSRLDAQVADLRLKLGQVRAPAEPTPDPRQKSREAAQALLRIDFNKVFNTIENVQQPGTRLRALRVDAAANAIHLEYALQTMQHASVISAALNAGHEDKPWELKELSMAHANARAGDGLAYRALWVGRLDLL